MSESMDRQLKLSELVRLRLHLVVCAWCSRYLKQIKILRLVMHSPAQQIAYSATALSFEARQRMAAALNRKFPN